MHGRAIRGLFSIPQRKVPKSRTKLFGPRNENGLDEAFALLKSHGCIYGASKNDFDNGTVIKRIVFTLKFRKVSLDLNCKN